MLDVAKAASSHTTDRRCWPTTGSPAAPSRAGAGAAALSGRRWGALIRALSPPTPAHSVGTGQARGKPWPLPPSVVCPRPTSLDQRWPAPRPAMSDPSQAPARQPGPGAGSLRRSARRPTVRAHSADGPGPRIRAREPGTAAKSGPARSKTAPPLATARQGTWHGSHSRRLAEAGGPPGRPARFFPVSRVGEDREKTSFFAQRRSTLWT